MTHTEAIRLAVDIFFSATFIGFFIGILSIFFSRK